MKSLTTILPDPVSKHGHPEMDSGSEMRLFHIHFHKSANAKHNGYMADSYISARTRLLRLMENDSQLPEAIIINFPFRENEFSSFCTWLKSHYKLSFIPVVYNKEFLNAVQFDMLQRMKLVDDITEVSETQAFLDKVKFLSKVGKYRMEKAASNITIDNQVLITKAGNGFNYLVKRAVDILIASLLILFLLPVFILIAIAIRVESRGPVFYTAQRAGKGFKVFNFYKFRTMIMDADKKLAEMKQMNQYLNNGAGASFFKIKNDPRITKVGCFLRNTSLDELPQFFNVLKGDMSIVGNRPLPLYEASTLTTNEWSERFMAPAGITGLWQVKKRGQEDMSAEDRISLDIDYARKNNLISDLKIMAVTPKALFQKTNV
ncbi:MAG: sugar transferase [Chitinophagaceae bacterium]|nr:sugar transferase [Chitinophagaceae bacterium]